MQNHRTPALSPVSQTNTPVLSSIVPPYPSSPLSQASSRADDIHDSEAPVVSRSSFPARGGDPPPLPASTDRALNSPTRNSSDTSRQSLVQAQNHIFRSFRTIVRPRPTADTPSSDNTYPGVSVIEPSNPRAVMTVQQFMDLRMSRLHNMIQHIDELGLYLAIHALLSLCIMLRLFLTPKPLFQYGVLVLIPFYTFKLAHSCRQCSRTSKRNKCYFSIQATNDLLYMAATILFAYKTYRGKGFPILSYISPLILALLLRLLKAKKDSTPCASLLQLFKTMGVIFRLSLVVTLSVKYQQLMDWSWSSAFWQLFNLAHFRPLWCSFAIQGVMILFTLVLLLWSLAMLCRRVYPFTFCALWAFFVTYGFTLCSSWFILNLSSLLQSRQSLKDVNLQIAWSLGILLLYFLSASIFTFLARKKLPFWFERMLYTPAEIDRNSNSPTTNAEPVIRQKRYATPKFITRITNAYFRKSKASERIKAEHAIRLNNRHLILDHTRPKFVDDDHTNSLSAGILMSSTHDIISKSELMESGGSLIRPKDAKRESSFLRQKIRKANGNDQAPNKKTIRFSFTVGSGGKGVRNMHSFFKKDNTHLKDPEKRVGVKDVETIDQLRKQECCVCLTSEPNCVLMECGHGSLCFPCGEKLLRQNQVCPLCRLEIKAVLQIDLKAVNDKKTLKVLRSLFKEGAGPRVQRDMSNLTENNVTERNSTLVVPEDPELVQQPSDPFELFSFRNRKGHYEDEDAKVSEEGAEVEEQDSFEDWRREQVGDHEGVVETSLVEDMETELRNYRDVKATTIVGIKRFMPPSGCDDQ